MRKSVSFIVVGGVIVALGFLVGCSTEGKARIGSEAKAAAEAAGPAITDAGQIIESAGGGIFGTLLKVLGGALIAYGGVKTVAKGTAKDESNKAIATFDAAPDNVQFTKDGSQIALPPEAPKA